MRTEIKLQIKTYCMCMCVFVSFVIGISFSIHYTLKYGVIVLQFCYLEKRFMHSIRLQTPVFETL